MKNIKRTLASVLILVMLMTSCPALSVEAEYVPETDLGLALEEVVSAPVEDVVEEDVEIGLGDVIVEEEEVLIPEDEAEDEIIVEETERFAEGYIWVAEMTDVFADAELTEVVGIFPATAAAYAVSRVEYEDEAEDMLEVIFAADGEEVTGYIFADAILTMTEEEIAGYKADIEGYEAAYVNETEALANTPFEYAEAEVEEPTEVEEAPVVGTLDAPRIYLTLEGGEGDEDIEGEVEGITISGELVVREKTTLQLSAAVTPEDANVGTVYWKSSNKNVATVNNDGVVTTKAVEKPTKVVITAYAVDGSGVEASVELIVEPIVVATKVVIEGVTNEVAAKKKITLTADVFAGEEELASIQNVTWKIKSGSKYASIKTNADGSATVTGKKAGKVTVIATSKDDAKVVSEPFALVVKSKAASSVKVTSVNGKTAIDMNATDKTLALQAAVSSKSASQKVEWSIDAKYADVAWIDQNGVLEVADGAEGEVVVKATALDGSKKSGSLTISIVNPVNDISFFNTVNDGEITDGEIPEVGVKKSIMINAHTTAEDGEPTVYGVTWTTSNKKIATVKAASGAPNTAVITGVKAGTVDIIATSKDGTLYSEPITVTVKPAVTSVKVTADVPFIDVDAEDKTLELTAVVAPATASQNVAWSIDQKYQDIATVENGVVTATGEKMGIVPVVATATDGSKKAGTLYVHIAKKATAIEVVGLEAVALKKSITLKPVITAKGAEGESDVTVPAGASLSITSGSKYATLKTNPDGSVTITGKKAGKVVVTAVAYSDPEVTATFNITVKKSVSNLKITGAKNFVLNDMPVDEAGNLVHGEETNYQLSAGDGVESWTSSNPELISVDEEGRVMLEKCEPGTAVITAVKGTKKGSVTIKAYWQVDDMELYGPLVDEEGTAHIAKGVSQTINAAVYPEQAENKALTWKTSNKKVATVSSAGVVKGVKAGTVTITATAKDGGYKETIKVVVHDAATSVALTADGAAVKSGSVLYLYEIGKTVELAATVKPSKAIQQVVYTSNNESVASVDEDGILTVNGNGTAKITATTVDGKNKSLSFYVKVGVGADEVVISGPRSVTVGKSVTLTAEVKPEEAINKAITWKVAEGYEKIATVSTAGVVKGKVAGYAKIIAYSDVEDVYGEYFVYVAPKATKVFIYSGDTDITGKTTEMYRNLGDGTLQLSARLNPNTADQSVTWKSSSTKIATVDANGVVTAKKNGTVTITATAADGSKKYATAKLKVTTCDLMVEVTAEGDRTELTAGSTLQMTAVVTPAEQAALGVTWSSSDETLATVDENGLVTAVAGAYGDVIISATCDVVTADYALTITVKPEQVTINDPTTTVIDLNSDVTTMQLSAVVGPEGASQNVIWVSMNDKVATVDANGLVTAVDSGDVTIVASHLDDASLTDTIDLKVVKLPKALEVKAAQTRLYAGESTDIAAVLTPEVVDNDNLTWTSSSELVTVEATEAGYVAKVSADAAELTEVTLTAETEEALDDVTASLTIKISSIESVFDLSDDGKTITKYKGNETVVRIPTSIEKIAKGAFDGCGFVTELDIDKTQEIEIESGALTGLSGLADENGFLVLSGRLITYAGTESEVTVPANVTRIDDGAFEGNTTITSVKLPNSVTIIGKRAFAGCTNLSEMTCYD